jgi:very-short-patch-repair endonuclease
MGHRIDPTLTARARELRNNPTPAERAVWHRISQYRPAFTRQLVVAPFIVDLACRQAKLAVELDGSQHLDAVASDARRTRFLEAQGWCVLRLWNTDMLTNPDGAVLHILERAAECLGGTHPQPLPFREGGKGGHALAERQPSTSSRRSHAESAFRKLPVGLTPSLPVVGVDGIVSHDRTFIRSLPIGRSASAGPKWAADASAAIRRPLAYGAEHRMG